MYNILEIAINNIGSYGEYLPGARYITCLFTLIATFHFLSIATFVTFIILPFTLLFWRIASENSDLWNVLPTSSWCPGKSWITSTLKSGLTDFDKNMCRRGRGLIGSRIKNTHLSDWGVLQSVRKCDVLTVYLLAKGHHQLVGRNPPPREIYTRLDCLGPEKTLYPQSGDRRISCHHSHIEAGVQSGKDPMEILVAQRQCPGETGVIRGLERGVVEPVNNFHWPHSRVFYKAQMLLLYYWQSTSQGQGHGAAKKLYCQVERGPVYYA